MQKHRYIRKYLPDIVLVVVFALIITFALYIVGNTYSTEYTVGNTYPTEYTKQTETATGEIYFLQNKISEQSYIKAETKTERYITTETVTENIDFIVGCGVLDAPPEITTKPLLPDRYTLTARERTLIASVAMLEDSDPAAMRSICEVILNRIESDRFPDAVHDVLYQKKQFNVIKRAAKTTPTEEAYAAVDAVFVHGVFVHGVNMVGGALFFAEKSVKPSRIARGLVLAGEFGDTKFYAQEE